MLQIRPVSDLRNNFAEISKIVHETAQPVFLTKNGYGDMVVMRGNKAILEHQKNGKKLYLFKMIASGFYEYIGEFKYHSHEIISGSDSKGNIRKSIRFNLQKVEEMNN